VVFGSKTELIDKMLGCLAAADMKLVYWREIIDGHGIDRLAERLDPAANRGRCRLIQQLCPVYEARRDRSSPFERERVLLMRRDTR